MLKLATHNKHQLKAKAAYYNKLIVVDCTLHLDMWWSIHSVTRTDT